MIDLTYKFYIVARKTVLFALSGAFYSQWNNLMVTPLNEVGTSRESLDGVWVIKENLLRSFDLTVTNNIWAIVGGNPNILFRPYVLNQFWIDKGTTETILEYLTRTSSLWNPPTGT